MSKRKFSAMDAILAVASVMLIFFSGCNATAQEVPDVQAEAVVMEPSLPASFCGKLETSKARDACYGMRGEMDEYKLRQFLIYYDTMVVSVDGMGSLITDANREVDRWDAAGSPAGKKAVYDSTYEKVEIYVDAFVETAEDINEFQHFTYNNADFCASIGMDPKDAGPELTEMKGELKHNLKYYKGKLEVMAYECELTGEEQEGLDSLLERIDWLQSRG
jgi:hypothetical protein